ncbi:MAG: helix-turn-helix transcriptional regulator [Proteobacteria bacterium]|nr:helix-turn-helix transcriptional regulator [Pseudomonadota bacterium]
MAGKESGDSRGEVIHQEAVNAAKDVMLDAQTYTDLASLLRHFGDPNRLRILQALAHVELCVGDLAALLGVTKSAVSHQLKDLKLAKLVISRRDGQLVYYSLADDHVRSIFDIALEHLNE